ncbi:acyltransferase [Rhodobacteraceae bacterium NNCM2]|nr:acyltransferase [Coraliihabitans acroporae]
MQYRREIDGLRALAVLPVIWFHAGFPGLPGGYLGVDVFFVISGFLITSILMEDLARGRFSIARFYERRARRILPALIVVVGACLPAAWLLMPPGQLQAFGQSLVALGLFASNLFFWRQSGYFAPVMEEAPLLHTWSLGVEEQFYLIFPLLLVFLWRRGGVWVAVGLAVAALASLGLAEGAQALGRSQDAFYLLPMRGWELLAGSLAALWVRRRGLAGRGAEALAGAGLGLIALGLVWLDPATPTPGRWTLLPVLGAVLVLVAARPGTGAHWLLTRAPLVGAGLISYSAYLWHQPLFAFARIAGAEPPGPGLMAVLAALTLVLAWATWRLVEQPFRQSGPGLPRGRVLGASAAGLAGIVALGLAGHWGKGFADWRFSPEQVRLFASARPSPLRKTCHVDAAKAPPPGEACTYFAGAAPTWAVIGDSHGVEIAHALGEYLAGQGESLVHLTASGCPPALGFATPIRGCAGWTGRSIDWLAGQTGIAHVLITYRHRLYLEGAGMARIADGATPAEKRALYRRGLAQMIARLDRPGRQIWVMAEVPEPPAPIGKLVRGAERAPALTFPAGPGRDWLAGLGPAAILDPAGALCDRGLCRAGQGGRSFYFDDNHLSLDGARQVGALLFPQPALATAR